MRLKRRDARTRLRVHTYLTVVLLCVPGVLPFVARVVGGDARSQVAPHSPGYSPSQPTQQPAPVALHDDEEEDEGIEPTHTHIGALTNFGVQPADIKKLKEAGISTAEGVLRITKRKLEQIKGISTAKAEKLREAAGHVAKKPSFQTAKDLQIHRDAHTVLVSTGSSELDTIFGGGIESGSITEFFGEYRTGKTQLCLTLCVTSFLPRALNGGAPRPPRPRRAPPTSLLRLPLPRLLTTPASSSAPSATLPCTGEGRALFLDTEGTFRPERLVPIAQRYQLDTDFVLENVRDDAPPLRPASVPRPMPPPRHSWRLGPRRSCTRASTTATISRSCSSTPPASLLTLTTRAAPSAS